jgi:hypothetical protein
MSGGINIPGLGDPSSLRENQMDDWTQPFELPQLNQIVAGANPVQMARTAIGTVMRIPPAVRPILFTQTTWANHAPRRV